MDTKKVINDLNALLEEESKKPNSHRILLGVQTKDKQIDFQQCGGSDATNISPTDPFFIASITKMYTATVIFQLVDEEKLRLDDCMSQYLPSEMIDKIHVFKGKDYSSEITIQELLHQTSGLPDYFQQKDFTTKKSVLDCINANEDKEWTRMDYLNMAKELKPHFAPSAKNGKRSLYSDTNYQLLGAIIEIVTKKSIQQNFQKRIFEPLQLSDKTYVFDRDLASDRQPQPMHFYHQQTELNIPNIMHSFPADGGVVSTMDDILKFLRGYFDHQLFDAKHLASTTSWNTVLAPPIQYGLGLMRFKVPKWMTLWLYDMPPFLGHSGANGSFAFYAPHKQVFLVGTFNQTDQEDRPFQFMMRVLKCLQ